MCPELAFNDGSSVAHLWYEIVQTEALRQGDVIQSLPTILVADDMSLPAAENVRDRLDVKFVVAVDNWIVLTPSCDLENKGRCRQVLLAQCIEARLAMGTANEKEMRERLQVTRNGLEPSRFLLPAHAADPRLPLSIVSIRSISLLPFPVITRFVREKPRLRLRHPFREKLANWCAQWACSVGPEIEASIPDFAKIYPAHVLRANTDLHT